MIDGESDFQLTPEGKVFKNSALWIGAFIGGPLAAGYIIAENFKTFNRPENAKKTWIFVILATILIFIGIFFIPDDSNFPDSLIPLIYTGIAALFFHYLQEKQIRSHIESGGLVYTWGRVVIVGIIGLAVTFITFIPTFFILDLFNDADTSTHTYGEMKHEISYNNTTISEAEADLFAEAFFLTSFFDDEVTKYVYIEKVDGTYEISISCIQSVVNDPEALEEFTRLRDEMKLIFPQTNIVFNLIVDYFDNVVKRIE